MAQTRKKKATTNVNVDAARQKRDAELEANMNAVQPSLEIGYSPLISTMIDFVNVTDTVGPSQG